MSELTAYISDSLPTLTVDWHARGLELFPWEAVATEAPRPTISNFVGPLIAKLHWANYQIWHYEDRCRSGVDTEIIRCKPQIDIHNQLRNDLIEQIDEQLIREQTGSGAYATETCGSIIDRLSVLALKVYHWSDLITAGKEQHRNKLAIAIDQFRFLLAALGDLLADMRLGRQHIRLFRQLKMYNDPTLNPKHKDATR